MCVFCNLPPHAPEPCTRTYCANCNGDHAASFQSCPKYQQQREILRIKTTKKCSMREAKNTLKQQLPNNTNISQTSFATIAANLPTSPLSASPSTASSTTPKTTKTLTLTTSPPLAHTSLSAVFSALEPHTPSEEPVRSNRNLLALSTSSTTRFAAQERSTKTEPNNKNNSTKTKSNKKINATINEDSHVSYLYTTHSTTSNSDISDESMEDS